MKVIDRAAETTTSTGTGDLTLAGTITGYQSLSGIGAGVLFPYIVTDYPAAINWEIGIGTYATGPTRLQRTTILSSSNGGAAVNWGAGTKLVRCGLPANLSLLNRHVARAAGFTAGAADVGTVNECAGTFTVAYAAAATLRAGWWCVMVNKSGVQTHDPNASENIDGVVSFTTAAGENFLVYCDGAELHTVGRKSAQTLDTTRIDVASASTVNLTSSAPSTRHINITGTTTITAFTVAAGLCYFVRFAASLTLTNNASIVTQTGQNIVTQAGDTCILRATAANTVEVISYSALSTIRLSTKQASTSGVAINFNSIPSWVRRITVMLDGVSTTGTSIPIIQLGDSGGLETTGYLGSAMLSTNGSATTVSGFTTGFGLSGGHAATTVLHGIAIIELVDPATNTWSFSFAGARTTDSAGVLCAGGTKSLSATLDRISITTVGGTETFDAGNINITME